MIRLSLAHRQRSRADAGNEALVLFEDSAEALRGFGSLMKEELRKQTISLCKFHVGFASKLNSPTHAVPRSYDVRGAYPWQALAQSSFVFVFDFV